MNDTAILDWIERHVTDIRVSREVTITWLKRGEERETVGKDLRDAVRKAAGAPAAKYSIFYPENGERFPGASEFETPLEAVVFWTDRRPDWKRLQSQGDDLATFINPRDGVMIVVRAVSQEGPA